MNARRTHLLLAGIGGLLLTSLTVTAQAGTVLYHESFDTGTASTAETTIAYPELAFSGGGNTVVINGVLNADASGVSNIRHNGFTGDLVIRGKIGGAWTNATGSTNVGMAIGGNRLVFHPNYVNTPGAFRVEGNGGFGNTNMGFVPAANGTLHSFRITLDSVGKRFLIAVTDANNPANVFTASFTNSSYTPGGDSIGFTRSGSGVDAAVFDDLVVERDGWSETIRASSPLHWYRFDETSGETLVDYGSGSLSGTYQNGAGPAQRLATPQGFGVRFDGSNDQVALGGSALSSTTPWTAEFILAKLSTKYVGGLLSGPSSAAGEVELRLDQYNNTGEIGYTKYNVADYCFTPAVVAPLSSFFHLAYVGDPDVGVSLYLNGDLVGTNPSFVELPRAYLGSLTRSAMILDEVVLYGRALSSAEIAAHALASGVVPEPSALVLAVLGVALAIPCGRRRRQLA